MIKCTKEKKDGCLFCLISRKLCVNLRNLKKKDRFRRFTHIFYYLCTQKSPDNGGQAQPRLQPEGKKVIFFDELPWMDAPRSGFLSELESFWNGWASARKDIVFVVCGSATSWMVKKIIKNKGGLHNRLTHRIALKPFSLRLCEEMMKSRGIEMTRKQILNGYMIFGGVPGCTN